MTPTIPPCPDHLSPYVALAYHVQRGWQMELIMDDGGWPLRAIARDPQGAIPPIFPIADELSDPNNCCVVSADQLRALMHATNQKLQAQASTLVSRLK